MKKIISVRRLAGLLLAAAFACLPACAKSDQGPVTVRIGVALYQQDDTFISTVVQRLEELTKAEEQARGIKINLNLADGRGSQSAQNEQVDRFLSRGYDVICVNIVDRTAAAVIVDKARAADVPVIFFNREPVEEDMMRWEKVFYVGSDAAQSGILQGSIVLGAWLRDSRSMDRNRDGILQYVMLEGEPGHQDALLRTENCVKVLTRGGVPTEKLANDTANWQRGQGSARMAQWLDQFSGEIEVVFSNNDDMALGAIDACYDAGMAPEDLPFVVGVDATPPALDAVAEGALKGTVQNDAAGQAESILTLACALAAGDDPAEAVVLQDGKYVRHDYSTVTADNLADYLPPSQK